MEIVTVSITCASGDQAQRIAQHLVENRLAACAQTHPIHSTYVWQGAMEFSAEVMLTAKTVTAKLPQIEAAVVALHSYEVPEILAQSVAWCSESYTAWLHETLKG
ncbi:divalent-cation tolerance protein CutA [Asticcacaulis biprosthecium]|nr:divalent-cation tolerance protein CutA [Asticcacaulis biprosthecium]